MNSKQLTKQQFAELCFNGSNDKEKYEDYIIKKECNVCGKEFKSIEGIDWYTTYWKPFKAPKHKNCNNKDNIIAQQSIDKDCNDCKFFKRGKLIQKGIFEGICTVTRKKVKAYPNFASGHQCFKHRAGA